MLNLNIELPPLKEALEFAIERFKNGEVSRINARQKSETEYLIFIGFSLDLYASHLAGKVDLIDSQGVPKRFLSLVSEIEQLVQFRFEYYKLALDYGPSTGYPSTSLVPPFTDPY